MTDFVESRKVVVAKYSYNVIFKVPKGIDLDDKSVVKSCGILSWQSGLFIQYVDGREETITSSLNEVEDERSAEHAKYPESEKFRDAGEYLFLFEDEELSPNSKSGNFFIIPLA